MIVIEREPGFTCFKQLVYKIMSDKKLGWSPPQIIWSAIIAMVAWTAIGFSWFGYGFNWQTQGAAKILSAEMLTESLATICVAQAQNASNTESSLTEFGELDKWKQRKYIETARWAIMPGNDAPENNVVAACADKLREI